MAGVSGTKENIQAMAAMGMGLLAGSVMMSLTLIWGSIVIFGHYDILPNSQKNKSFNLTGFNLFLLDSKIQLLIQNNFDELIIV